MKYDTVISDGIITLKNENTTLAFVRFDETGLVEYIFTQPMYRKSGLAKKLLNMVREITGKEPIPSPPISPLGEKLFNK
jgi:hypothetical protein